MLRADASQPDLRDDNRNWTVVAAVAAFAAAAIAVALTAVWHVQNLAVARGTHGQGFSAREALAALLHPLDLLFIVLLGVAGIALFRLEWPGRALGRFLRTATGLQAFLVLTALLVWLGVAYLFPGLMLAGDAGSHIARFHEVRVGLQSGILSDWTNYDYLGSPLLGFTGPLVFVTGGAMDLLFQDANLTAKIFLLGCHLGTGWLFYLFVRRLGLGRAAALAGALAYGGSFAHLHLLVWRGALPQGITMAALILLFLSAEGVMQRRDTWRADFLLFALATAALLLNHQPHAVYAAVYLALFGGFSLLLGRWCWNCLPWLVSGGIAGAAIATVAILPILMESDWVMITPEGALFSLQVPDAGRVMRLLRWSNVRTVWDKPDYWTYLGVTVLALALLGAVGGLSGRLGANGRKIVLAALPCLLLSPFMTSLVVRDIMFMLLFLAVMTALGMEFLRALAPRAAVVGLLLLVADLSSTSLQPLSRTDKQFLLDAGAYLERAAPDTRVLEASVGSKGEIDISIGPSSGPYSYRTVIQRVGGHHSFAATRAINFALVAAKQAERELSRDGILSPETRAMLAVLNVSRVICNTPTAMGCPAGFADTQEEGPLGRVVRIPGATPALFAPSLAVLEPPPLSDKPMITDFPPDPPDPRIGPVANFFADYLKTADIGPNPVVAKAIPVRRAPGGDTPPPGPMTGDGQPHLEAYTVSLASVDMTVWTGQETYLQLAHPFFPATSVTVNGQKVAPTPSSIGLIVVRLKPGRSVIALHHEMTPVRILSGGVSIAALLATLGFAGFLHLRRRDDPPVQHNPQA